jgi:acetolactate synthase-1/2/3 large subunit
VEPEYWDREDGVDNYVACEVLSDALGEGEVIVQANGSACIIGSQAMMLKPGSRMIENSGTASMGYDIPAAIGACFANDKERVICLSGDGSIMMNLQELQTIVCHQLPVKIVLFNNGGYVSIRQTQDNLFAGHRVGEAAETGVSFPDFQKLSAAFGIACNRIDSNAGLAGGFLEMLETPGPFLCEVMVAPTQTFRPKVQAEKLPDGRIVSKPLEDMFPFLDREEFVDNMIVPPWPETR